MAEDRGVKRTRETSEQDEPSASKDAKGEGMKSDTGEEESGNKKQKTKGNKNIGNEGEKNGTGEDDTMTTGSKEQNKKIQEDPPDGLIGFADEIFVIADDFVSKIFERVIDTNVYFVFGEEAATYIRDKGHDRGTKFKDISWYKDKRSTRASPSKQQIFNFVTAKESLGKTERECLNKFAQGYLTETVYNTCKEMMEARDENAVSRDFWSSTLMCLSKIDEE